MTKSIKHLLGQLKIAWGYQDRTQRALLAMVFGMILLSLVIMPMWLYLIVTGASNG